MNDFEQKINELTGRIIDQINANECSFHRFKQRLLKKIFKGPRKEISHDWHVVNSFLERAIENFKMQNYQKLHDESSLQILAKINAYLELAKFETDFAQAWTFVNMADSLLPLVVSEKELSICTVRLQSRDHEIPKSIKNSLPENIKKILDEDDSKIAKDADHKYKIFRVQEIRALLWNSLNRKISLRISLWRGLGCYLLIGLIVAIAVAEYLNLHSDKPNALIIYPFFAISLLGFFGGGISAFLIAREKAVDITSYQTIKVYTVLRMLLGAAGSFVVYIAAYWLGNKEIVDQLNTNIYVFLGTGIVAGFSERLFVGTLEKMADKLDIIGKADDNKSNQ